MRAYEDPMLICPFFGDDESKLGDYVWYNANLDRKTHPVGEKKPNP